MLASAAKMGGKASPAAGNIPRSRGMQPGGRGAGMQEPCHRGAPPSARSAPASRFSSAPRSSSRRGAPGHFPSAAALGRAKLPPPSKPAAGPPHCSPPEPFAPPTRSGPTAPHRAGARPPRRHGPRLRLCREEPLLPPPRPCAPRRWELRLPVPSFLAALLAGSARSEASPAPRPPAGVAVSRTADKQIQGGKGSGLVQLVARV